MSRLTESRVSHLAHLITSELEARSLVDFKDMGRSLRLTKAYLEKYFSEDDQLDDAVRRKIHSLSRGVQVGSREWDVLYRKYLEEEIRKRRP